MTRTMLFALTASTAVGSATYLYGQGTPVLLQSTTPGAQQVGNANVSGRIIAGSIQAESSAPTAQVIVGNATSGTGASFGGFFRSDSVMGRALYGRASASSGTTHGVWGQADSPGGRGVTGLAPASTGNATGVWGQTASTTGRGVYGFTTATSGVNYGVLGQSSSPTGYGVFSLGNLHATGIISGNGSGLTNLNASSIATGTLADARLSSNVALLGASQTFMGANIFSGGLSTTGFTLSTGGATGRVLMSDGAGVGTWQADGLALPFDGTGASGGPLFRVINSSGHGLWGQIDATNGIGVVGVAAAGTGTTWGVYGQNNSTSGRGVHGVAHANSGTTYGVSGESASPSGRGVYGLATALSGITYGVSGESYSPNGYGVYGTTSGGNVSGVYGRNTATSGAAFGIRGVSDAPSGSGVYGRGNYAGVNAQVFGTSGAGVLGFSSPAAGTTYGVWGFANDAADYGVYSNGRFAATATKSFRIDHPFDPENRYLLHYCTEMPEPQNAYNGVVTTDANGEAWVQLPDYFGEINKDFKYQLTVVDDTDSDQFVMAKIAREIRQNKFRIRTSAPRVTVSWRVEATRNDRWVRKNGAPVEVDKQDLEKGTYQHPELYGFGPERGMNHNPEAQRPKSPPITERRKSPKK